MFRHYLKITLRNIIKDKFYSALNIAGLAAGLTACLLVTLYVVDEFTFDKFHDDYEQIYRIGMHVKFSEQDLRMSSSCPPLAMEMVRSIPGVEQATRVNPWLLKNVVMKYDDKAFTETKAFFADSNFFDFFSFNLLAGNVKTALKDPYSIVLTPLSARKYFGDESPIGKSILVGGKNELFKVTGIAAAPPANSRFQFDMLVSSTSDPSMSGHDWGDNNGTHTFIRKNPDTPTETIELGLKAVVDQHISPMLEEAFGMSIKEFEKQGSIYAFFPYSLADSHLYHSEMEESLGQNSDIQYVYIIIMVGVFILVIAVINFMNLTTARSAGRAKEVGMRKTLGSSRSKLIFQFLSETLVFVFVASSLAFVATYVLLPSINLLTGKVLSFDILISPLMLAITASAFIVIALLAGSYPAFYLTSFNPIEVLKGILRSGLKSKGVRSSLVVVQFTISIALMICTMIVFEQLRYMQQKNIGLDKESVLFLYNTERLGTQSDAFLHSISSKPNLIGASYIDNIFPGINRIGSYRSAGSTKDHLFPTYKTDYDHLDVLKIELVAGRFFSREISSDTLGCVINETAARELGWTDPLREKFFGDTPIPVIGVIKDFNLESFKMKVKPLVIHFRKKSNYMLIRYQGNTSEAIAAVEQLWKQYSNREPFEYAFLDRKFDELFREEQRLGEIFFALSSMAIFIACLGLFGLASFTAEQRAKEIGIRKVLGASVNDVNRLLSKELLTLLAVSFLIAAVLSWFSMKEWLSTFAYRTDLRLVAFLFAGVLASFIAAITVMYHFIKAARSNPIDTLRSE